MDSRDRHRRRGMESFFSTMVELFSFAFYYFLVLYVVRYG